MDDPRLKKMMSDASRYMIRNCTIAFKCDREWESLESVPNVPVRHCDKCERYVYLCNTSRELIDALAGNQCVAIPIKLHTRRTHVLGMVVHKKRKS